MPDESADPTREELLRSLWAATPPELIAQLPRGGTMLDYLGHADTCRLFAAVDPLWKWEPKGGWDDNGEPRFIRTQDGYPVRLWIDLTILGVTRPGVGTVGLKKGDPEKELIGDAIRNAAMRFGVGADLWSKAKGALDDTADHHTAPAQPAPVDWFKANGWDGGQADHDTWRTILTESLKAAPENIQGWFADARKAIGYEWARPATRAEAQALSDLFEQATTPNADSGVSPPETGDSPSSAPEAAPAPSEGATDDPGRPFEEPETIGDLMTASDR